MVATVDLVELSLRESKLYTELCIFKQIGDQWPEDSTYTTIKNVNCTRTCYLKNVTMEGVARR